MGDQGLYTLCEALKINTTLTMLDLSCEQQQQCKAKLGGIMTINDKIRERDD